MRSKRDRQLINDYLSRLDIELTLAEEIEEFLGGRAAHMTTERLWQIALGVSLFWIGVILLLLIFVFD